MKSGFHNDKMILYPDLIEVVRIFLYKFPRQSHYVLLKELEDMKLLKKEHKNLYKIIGKNKEKALREYSYPLWGP